MENQNGKEILEELKMTLEKVQRCITTIEGEEKGLEVEKIRVVQLLTELRNVEKASKALRKEYNTRAENRATKAKGAYYG